MDHTGLCGTMELFLKKLIRLKYILLLYYKLWGEHIAYCSTLGINCRRWNLSRTLLTSPNNAYVYNSVISPPPQHTNVRQLWVIYLISNNEAKINAKRKTTLLSTTSVTLHHATQNSNNNSLRTSVMLAWISRHTAAIEEQKPRAHRRLWERENAEILLRRKISQWSFAKGTARAF